MRPASQAPSPAPAHANPSSGWPLTRLEELVSPHPGYWGADEPNETTEPVLVLGVGNVTNEGNLDLAGATTRHLTPREFDGIAEEGDLLVVKSSGSAASIRSGKAAICPPDLSGKIACSNFMIRLAVHREKADPFLLWLLLNSQAAKKFIRGIVGASTYPNIKWGDYRNFAFPLPPLPEQRRIAARLREQLSAVAEARAAVQAQSNAAQDLPAVQLRAAFTHAVAARWPKCKLGAVLRLRKEVVHPRDNPSGPAVFVGLEHVHSLTGERTGSLPVEMSELTGRKPRFYTGDIVYGYLRPYLNKLWVAEFDGLCSVDQYVYEVNREKADTDFVAWFMRSPVYLERAPIDASPGQLPRIRTEEVASVEINLPPVSQQRALVAQIQKEFTETTALKQTLSARLTALDHLPAALLREAFNGRV